MLKLSHARAGLWENLWDEKAASGINAAFKAIYGGGGGNRTPVRKSSTASSTYLALSFDLTRNPPTGRLVTSDPLGFRACPRGEDVPYFLLFMTLLLVLPSPTRRPIGAASGP